MNPELIPHYFNENELQALQQLEGKPIYRVVYTIWSNVAKQEEVYESLDWISLFFEKARVDFTVREDQQGMEIRELNFALEQTRIAQQFRGQVELRQVDMSESPVWEAVIGNPLNAIGFTSPMDGYFQSNLIRLEFLDKTVEIALGEEGLLAYQL